ncbi:MAG: YhcN/YlaJ family sporulation lipoprotein [Firmicutes bacterium]|nr:YhcN/YlaJ family sporulation lipoprotein [Bacillota bacterium]
MKYLTVLLVAVAFFNAGCTLQNSPAQKPQTQQSEGQHSQVQKLQTQQSDDHTEAHAAQELQPQTQPGPAADQAAAANTALAAKSKAAAKKLAAVEDAVVVVLGKNISVDVKVTGFNRLRLPAIRREVHAKIAHMAPGYRVFVSTDKKIYWELEQLNSQIQQGGDSDAFKELLDKIDKRMRG